MVKNGVIAVLVVGLISLGYWGYVEHRDKNALIIQNENNYQQAYHELTYYVDRIHDSLGSSLATSKASTSAPQLAEVWRLSAQAREDIGKLPLKLMPLNDTATFLSNIGNYSFQTAIKNPTQGGLSQTDYKKLESLYNQSSKVEEDLRSVQSTIINNNLKWTDVETALNSNQPRDNQIIDGLKTVNQKAADYDKLWQPTINSPMAALQKLNDLSGANINKGEAITKAKSFIGIQSSEKAVVQKLGKGAGYNGYNLEFTEPNKEQGISTVITEKGGHLVWFLNHRTIGKGTISLHQATIKAASYLKEKDYNGYEAVLSDQYDTIGVLSFAKRVNGVLIYPDSIKVKVALDNGEIIGMDQTEHLITEVSTLPSMTPKITEQQARQGIRDTMTIKQSQLVIYKNEQDSNVLCYEFLVTKGKDTYRILINAQNGTEENVNMLTV